MQSIIHPKMPQRVVFPPKYHRGKKSYSSYHVHIKLIYLDEPRSNPPDPMPWDDGYHNSYIPVKVFGGREDARNLALIMAYATYPISHSFEYVAHKVQLIKRRHGSRLGRKRKWGQHEF